VRGQSAARLPLRAHPAGQSRPDAGAVEDAAQQRPSGTSGLQVRTFLTDIASSLFVCRVLGKFGGGNRKMMIEPQKLDYVSSDFDPPAIIAKFHEQNKTIEFPVQKVRRRWLVLDRINSLPQIPDY
jgi:hypothetical protein